jgi:acyl-coenzyme A synthetase/AMP-(fatty) acid ligase/acyl carrier protein
MVEHRNVVAYLHAFFRKFDLNSDDTVIQLASHCFDVFVEEVFPVLSKGGKLFMPRPSELMDTDVLARLILKQDVSIIDCTPLLLNEFNKIGNLPEKLRNVRTFISGGDVLKAEFVDNLLKIGKVYNTYGPTETTVCATYYNYTTSSCPSISIGKPIANYRIYILDENSKPVPRGVCGEMCVSGPGVTRGYLNRPELTAEKFPPSSLLSFSASQLLRFSLYRTGDLARWLSDGNIEFLGRMDDQVKIRGFRIELGEIEARLAAHEEIKEAVVLDKQDEKGNKYLCAYILPAERKGENPFNVPGLRAYLSDQLPDYMIPTHFIELNEIPLTSHGKIDKKSLLALEGDIGAGTEYVPPTDEVEKKLADLWAEILDKDRVGIHDNFFDLGGQSLKAMRLMAVIREAFHVKIPLVSFFEVGTVKGIAGLILEGQSHETPAVPPSQQPPQAAGDHSFSGIKFKKQKRIEVEL